MFLHDGEREFEYETNTYPRQVIEAADKILMNMEEKEKGKLRFAKNVPAWPAMPEDDRKSSGSGGMANALRERAFWRERRGVSSARVSRERTEERAQALVVVDEDDDG